MTENSDRDVKVIRAHQDLVAHIEKGSSMMRGLSAVTIVVAVFLAASYVSQLLLPLSGVTSVTVNLTDPGNLVVEAGVLALSILWLYVGLRDYRFASKMRKEIAAARKGEDELRPRLAGPGS